MPPDPTQARTSEELRPDLQRGVFAFLGRNIALVLHRHNALCRIDAIKYVRKQQRWTRCKTYATETFGRVCEDGLSPAWMEEVRNQHQIGAPQ